jgi:PAS domain S-box-containing protein
VLVFRDIAERKAAEEDLARVTAESERRKRLYETILSATPDFVYVFSLDYRVLYANDSLVAMWGAGDPVGKTFLEIGYEPWHAERHCREIDQVRATKQPVRGEVPFTGTRGRKIYDYIFVPVLGTDGEVEAVAGTTRDVTERKAMEDEIRDADRKKDDFIALLAHELRNPLAPIRNGLQVLRLAGGDVGAVARARAIMDRQLSHMVRLIDDLLDVSRISRNKMELRRERVLLADVVGSAVETAQPLIEAAGHELSLALPPGPVFLDADLTRLAQVVSNLLTNSAKYTERGGKVHPSSGEGPAELRARLGESRADITKHFRFEEQNGYMDVVRKREPRLERNIQQLADEHRRLVESLDGLVREFGTATKLGDTLRQEVRAWVEHVRQHEAREHDLVQDAFNLDIGPED